MDINFCKSCKWFDAEDDQYLSNPPIRTSSKASGKVSICRRNPPSMLGRINPDAMPLAGAVWPIVKSNDWCGLFEPLTHGK